jgi:GT2 family glycosyltransferase
VQKSISVVIPNYNGKDLLQKNLPSVYNALRQTNSEFEVIVVDDASSDESVQLLKDSYKDVIVLVNERNQGFSPTINRGIFKAKNDLVLLLNSDVSLSIDYFKPYYKYFDREDTFGVSGRFTGFDDGIIQDAGRFPQLMSSKKIQPYNFFVENPKEWVPTFAISGGGSLVDRKKLVELNGFDEIYAPFYYEDTDLSIRAWRAGWRCYYEHDAICMHATTSTINRFHKSRRVWILTQRNKLILHALHLSFSSKLIWNLRQTFTLFIQTVFFRWKYHEAFLNYLRKWSQIQNSKKRIVALAKDGKSVEEIMDSIGKEINRQKITKV